jgi:Pyridoxamine 5'-phosphate oxidase
MPDRDPVPAEPMTAGATTPTPWARARGLLEAATATYWSTTVRPDGTPHVRPVLAVWVDDGLFFAPPAACGRPRGRVASALVHTQA